MDALFIPAFQDMIQFEQDDPKTVIKINPYQLSLWNWKGGEGSFPISALAESEHSIYCLGAHYRVEEAVIENDAVYFRVSCMGSNLLSEHVPLDLFKDDGEPNRSLEEGVFFMTAGTKRFAERLNTQTQNLQGS